MELIAPGGAGHRRQSGSAQVLPEAEGTYRRKNHSEFALFLIFSPSNVYWWPFSSSPLLFSETSAQWDKTELLLTPALLKSARVFLHKLICFKRQRSLIYSFFPFEVPRYHFTNSKDSWTSSFSWRASVSCVWVSLQRHWQHSFVSQQSWSVLLLTFCKVLPFGAEVVQFRQALSHFVIECILRTIKVKYWLTYKLSAKNSESLHQSCIMHWYLKHFHYGIA